MPFKLEIELPDSLTPEKITQVLAKSGGYTPTKTRTAVFEERFATLQEADARVTELQADSNNTVTHYGPHPEGGAVVQWQQVQQVPNGTPEEFAIAHLENAVREMFAVAAEATAEQEIEDTVADAKRSARAAARASVSGGKARFVEVA